MADYDVAVIGSGPGGYVAAIRAGQLGLKAAVIERDNTLGGVCLNWGCIPSKALLKNAEVLELFQQAEAFGISVDNIKPDFGKAIDRSRDVVTTLTKGVAGLLKKNKVDHIQGTAKFIDANTLQVEPDGRKVTADNIIIATGARARSIPGLEIDKKQIITSREALELRTVPDKVVIVGGGATGAEFAYLWNVYGAEVTIVEMQENILPNEDEDISRLLQRSFEKQGIKVLTKAKIDAAELTKSSVSLKISSGDDTSTIDSSLVLIAAGVQANTEELGLEDIGVEVDRGFVKVDSGMNTNITGIKAIGDVTGIMLLAHVGMAQGVMAAELIAGLDSAPLQYQYMPRATYCHPQVASFGLTEKQAKENGYDVKVGKFPFQASGKALATRSSDGLTKVVSDKKYGEILGAHMIGSEVTEMLAEWSVAHHLEGTVKELGWVVHSHPSISETLKEAALAVDGEAIHI